jgi:glycosyltransferase involved in cell wall biosynthesis
MRVLFTSPILEHPAAGGPQLRIENSIKALGRISELHVVSRASLAEQARAETEKFFRSHCAQFLFISRLMRKAHPRGLLRVVRGGLRRLLDAATREDARFLLDHIDRYAIDVLWLGYGNISFPLIRRLRSLRPRLKMVCDTDSVWSRFVLREAPYAAGIRKLRILREGKKKELEERAWVALCDVTTAVSEVDADYYRGLALEPQRVHLFRNVIDVESYEARPPRPADMRSPSIYLAGTFGYSPMDSAAKWMLEKVFPRLLERHPDLHFYLVGKNSDKSFGHLNGTNVTATGRLESVLPYLMHTDVALVPLMFESGTRFKILEAGACGIPLVSTTLGAEGIPVVDGEHILIADDPERFAGAILRLLDDKSLASRLAARCSELVRREFSIEALAEEARRILAYLAQK